MKAYINLHSNCNYHEVKLCGKMLYRVRQYIENVSWLRLVDDIVLVRCSEENGFLDSSELVRIFANRLVQFGVEVFVREDRQSKWENYVKHSFTDEYLLSVECLFTHDQTLERKAIENTIEKYKQMQLKGCEDYTSIIKFTEDRLNTFDLKEINRVKALKDMLIT